MRCDHFDNGVQCREEATRLLYAPSGRPIVFLCQTHAEAVIKEYAEKLAETWTSVVIDENGDEV